MPFFIVRNHMGSRDPEWHHYFVVKAASPHVPENVGWKGFNVVGYALNEEGCEALKRFFTNARMREWIEAWGYWPQQEGWH